MLKALKHPGTTPRRDLFVFLKIFITAESSLGYQFSCVEFTLQIVCDIIIVDATDMGF